MFKFPLDSAGLFEERANQMRGWGIPARTVYVVRQAVTDSWADGPGGWVYEWVQQAKKAEQAQRWLEAANCYGAAKFPVVCTPSREQALQNQIRTYLRASARFPCRFERAKVEVSHRGHPIPVVVHLFERSRHKVRPLVCLSGGVDTLKMELHRLAVLLAVFGDFKVAVMDMPGTGESSVSLHADCDQIYRGVIEQLKDGNAKTAMFGISFGGHWAAKLALSNAVDAAVDIGGPVGFASTEAAVLTSLPNGMTAIVANAMGLDHMPSEEEAAALLSSFSLRAQGLFDKKLRCPLLVINGDQDPYISMADTLGFEEMQNASVWLVKDGSHCAAEKFTRILPATIAWLREKLHGPTRLNTALGKMGHIALPPMRQLRRSMA